MTNKDSTFWSKPFISLNSFAVISLALLLLGVISYYIVRFAPPFVIGDRLNLLAPIYLDQNFLQGFFHQHGSHFLGVTHLITSFFVFLAGKSPFIDLYSGLFTTALLVTLLLVFRRRYIDLPIGINDVIILLFALSLAPAKSFYFFPHIHLMLPIFTLLFSLSWYIKWGYIKIIFQCILMFLAAFSGYAFIALMGFVVMDIFKYFVDRKKLMDIWIEILVKGVVLLFTGGLFIFLYNYPAGNPNGDEGLSVSYIIQMLQNATGTAWSNKGSYVFPFLLVFLVFVLIRLFKVFSIKKNIAVLNLIVAIFLFVIISGIKRSGDIESAGHAQRYFSTMVLLPISVYFISTAYLNHFMVKIGWWFFAFCVYLLPLKPAISDGQYFKEKVILWESCLEKNKDFQYCNDAVELEVVPNAKKYKDLYLKINT
ncbi:MAG: hypothetical protein JJU02_04480 [Cryomorphaceae bacterium]|nr:hypothetical protein [Cryomorphaceae bacterium]